VLVLSFSVAASSCSALGCGAVKPHAKCKLRLLKLDRVKDYLLMEEEFIQNQGRLKPQEEKTQVCGRGGGAGDERTEADGARGWVRCAGGAVQGG
jgi:hypothetical protein